MKPRYADYIVEAHALRDAGRCEVDMRGVYLGVVCGMFTAPFNWQAGCLSKGLRNFRQKAGEPRGMLGTVGMANGEVKTTKTRQVVALIRGKNHELFKNQG